MSHRADVAWFGVRVVATGAVIVGMLWLALWMQVASYRECRREFSVRYCLFR